MTQGNAAVDPKMGSTQVAVWDIAVRVFHWSLVAGMAYELLARAGTDSHEVVGYVVLALVGFRLVWGFVGSRHARFADFVTSPRVAIAYLQAIAKGHPKRYLGHNPAGAAMVLALLAMVAGTALSGWAMTTDALWGRSWIEEVHEVFANATILLIVGHVLGVILASIQHRENLVRSMFTGRKPRV